MTDVEALHAVHWILANTYTFEGRQIWLASRNRNLDMQAPSDLIKAGEHDRVFAEARRAAGDGNAT